MHFRYQKMDFYVGYHITKPEKQTKIFLLFKSLNKLQSARKSTRDPFNLAQRIFSIENPGGIQVGAPLKYKSTKFQV